MSDNLTVTIGADSSKLRAELALVNQASKAAQKELQALAAAFNKSGQSADRLKLDAKARQVDTYTRSVTALKQQLAQLSPTFTAVGRSAENAASGIQELVHTARGAGRIVSEFSGATKSLESFGRIFGGLGGGLAGGVFGVAITKAFSAITDQINETSKAIRELRDRGRELGLKPIQLQAAREVVQGLGEDAKVADDALAGMQAQLEETRRKSAQQGGDVPVWRGGTGKGLIEVTGAVNQMTTIMRGGAQALRDFSKPLELIGVDLSDLPLGKLGDLTSRFRQLQGFIAASKTTFARDPLGLDLISKALFNRPAETMLKSAPALLEQTRKQIEELQKSQRGVTPPREELDAQLRASQAARSKAWDEATAPMTDAFTRAEIKINDSWTASLNQLSATTQKFMETGKFFDFSGFHQMTSDISRWWGEMLSTMSTAWSQAWKGMGDVTSAVVDGFKSLWQSAIDWLSKAVGSVVQAVKDAASSVSNALSKGGGSSTVLPFASGGMVRGSGTGTSDSILARLSNGEFVMRADAVRRLGSDFLSSLNNPGFALGGLVPRFAEGGLVGAGGGSTVNLHLGGNVFSLSATESVASALVVEAHRQQMRSAGTKPSWYAARPSGK